MAAANYDAAIALIDEAHAPRPQRHDGIGTPRRCRTRYRTVPYLSPARPRRRRLPDPQSRQLSEPSTFAGGMGGSPRFLAYGTHANGKPLTQPIPPFPSKSRHRVSSI
ncbi:hypothetical protein LZ554_007091 [Drepanopeziza brunnea f. sp. 'monogermtubi']|nr:hypothetical protein LZ554_007091 [Drepanopeziza brunnea f. sp. 'monogermtubi']